MFRQSSAPTEVAAQRTRNANPPGWERPAKIATVLFTIVALVYSLRSGALWNAYAPLSHGGAVSAFFWFAFVWSLVCYAALVWRLWLWKRYRPMESVSDAELPTLSVIIPAFNEGALVRQSIRSVAENVYPSEKLQIIVIDDGSRDDTWDHIQAAAEALGPGVDVLTLRHTRNMGKRRALYNGFKHARGAAIITVDSDTIVDPRALRNAVSPLVRDERIGAVAGCVEVLNPYESIFTRFLKATFALSFKFVRAYQSEYRGVFCTPGAISVYRASVVREVADEWLNQTFLGQPCTIGEDRAMTNLILRGGWLTCYQQNARVWSQMPTSFTGMSKMLLRWARSNIRETIILNRFMYKPFRKEYLWTFRLNMMLVLLTLIVPYLLVGNSWYLTFTSLPFAMRHAGMVAIYGATMALIYYRCQKDHDWVWLLLYEFFWVVCLAWIMPYALVSLKKTGWLTRGEGVGGPAGATHGRDVAPVLVLRPQVGGPMLANAAAVPVAAAV
ncbi:MAG: glycosyltransferase [Phycisphaerae bacterium]